MPDPILVLDTGSPLVSVAVGRGGAVVAARSVGMERSSARLIELIGEVLGEAGLRPAELGGIAALAGPGSFTGLRIGLATVLGLHQALRIPATTLSSLAALAASALPTAAEDVAVAAVDALRGEWSAQAFAAGTVPRPRGEAGLVPGPELPRLAGTQPCVVVGFGVSRLAALPEWPPGARLLEPGPLAPAAVRLAAAPGLVWDPARLVAPAYSRPPAVALPRRPAAEGRT